MTDACILPHREPKTTLDGLMLCPGHLRWMTSTLDDIIDTTCLLPAFLEPGSSIDDGRQVKSKRVDPPAPIRLDVVGLTDRRTVYRYDGDVYPVLAVMEAWARLVREEREITPPSTPATILSETSLLIVHAYWIAAQPFVDEFAAELRQVKSALHSAIGDYAPRSVGTCPVVHPESGTCGGRLYQDRYGRLAVSCSKCGEEWGEMELRRLGLVIGA